jgi:predicted MPP superfamily phosphohydrolase
VKYLIDDLAEPLSRLSAVDGVMLVPGNHDYAAPETIHKLREMSAACDFVDLSNRVCTIKRGGALLHIAGVDDICARRARLDMVLDALPEDGAAILLAHEPDFADISAATGRFDLQLSGHTHGAQIYIPGLTRIYHPLYGRRYLRGHYNVAGMQLYVNRGIGMVTVHLRFNSRPEITLLTLNSSR